MGVLRKAGVWLGLVEDDEDRDAYDDDFGEEGGFMPARPATSGRRATARSTHRDQRVDERDPRGFERDFSSQRERRVERQAGTRREPGRGDRDRRLAEPSVTDQASVRPLSRQPVAAPSPSSHATRDNLALAPQVHPRERAVVGDDQGRRYQITTLHPTTYSEARTIGELFRDGVPVIMNLTEMAEADARRLVDFAAGLAFALRGTIDRVTNRVFLLSPANIQVTAEDRARIAEGEFFDQTR